MSQLASEDLLHGIVLQPADDQTTLYNLAARNGFRGMAFEYMKRLYRDLALPRTIPASIPMMVTKLVKHGWPTWSEDEVAAAVRRRTGGLEAPTSVLLEAANLEQATDYLEKDEIADARKARVKHADKQFRDVPKESHNTGWGLCQLVFGIRRCSEGVAPTWLG